MRVTGEPRCTLARAHIYEEPCNCVLSVVQERLLVGVAVKQSQVRLPDAS
jgi:hypothetical protein